MLVVGYGGRGKRETEGNKRKITERRTRREKTKRT
jgi:hypothetical protein